MKKLSLIECNEISAAVGEDVILDNIDKRKFQIIFKRYIQAINTMKRSGFSSNDIKRHLTRAKRYISSEPSNSYISFVAITVVLENIDMYLEHKM